MLQTRTQKLSYNPQEHTVAMFSFLYLGHVPSTPHISAGQSWLVHRQPERRYMADRNDHMVDSC